MVDSDAFRAVMGQFATGVTVVTIPGESPHGITVNAFASVSLDPPLVLVALDHGTEAHRLLDEGGAESYCVNVLTRDQRHLGEYFAGMADDDDADPFEAEATSTEATGAPVFRDSLAYVDCTLYDTFEAGDHTVYVGRAERAETLNADAAPLTFFQGDWGTIATDGA